MNHSAGPIARPTTGSLKILNSLGAIRVLAVGVDKYLPSSGFHNLTKCSSDAAAVINTFKTLFQLGASTDADGLTLRTSKAEPYPTRGQILADVAKLSSDAKVSDRILFYFSGHGHRINEKFFLVPADAYASDAQDALVPFDRVIDLLNNSLARQKIVVLDACLSGPDVSHLKVILPGVSSSFLSEYISRTKGVAIISSCGGKQTSTTKSPNPKLSLFTHFFIEALSGRTEALDSQLLTLHGLFAYVSQQVARTAKSQHGEQQPVLNESSSGVIVLGDFTHVLSIDSVDVGSYPVESVGFLDSERADVRDVLTNIKRWSAYSEEYLEQRVNSNLGDHLRERLGKLAAKLRSEMGFNVGDVGVSDASIVFPGGSYSATYVAEGQRQGVIVHRVEFDSDWFGRYDDMVNAVEIMGLYPTKIELALSVGVDPLSMIAGLEANQWQVVSQLEEKIEARRGTYGLEVSPRTLLFTGFVPSEILGTDADKAKASLAAGVLALLGPPSE